MDYRVQIFIDPCQELSFLSKVYTGLCGLERQGRASVTFVRDRARASNPEVAVLEVTATSKGHLCRQAQVAVDVHDRSDKHDRDLLAGCDVYLKRSYYPPHLSSLPPPLRQKVAPFGLNYPVRDYSVTRRVLWALGLRYAGRLLGSALVARDRFREEFGGLKSFLTSPSAGEFELAPEEPLQPVVLFQTRVWEPGESRSDNLVEVNEGRATLVRLLRRAFGDRFWGGLVPTPYALRHYPDAICDKPSKRKHYIAMSKQALVGVYTRGLCHSIAFKLPEYLAASKAIVADGFRNELPAPLQEGTHYLGFREPAECVEQCARLLKSPGLTAAMRQANHRYYRQEVEPTAHLRKCLDLARDRDREPGDRTGPVATLLAQR
jgi:hypothetical protein